MFTKIKIKRLRCNGANPKRFDRSQIKFLAYLVPICVVMALPIVFIVMNAFKPMDELFAYPPRFFVRNPTLVNFKNLFSLSSTTAISPLRYLFNSIVASVCVVFATLALSLSAGYVLSKKHFKYKKLLFDINTLGMMFVPIAVSIPRYFVVVYTGMQNTFWANIIPLLVTPTSVFLVKQFMDQLPDALIEAAVIDGANDFQILRRILMPMVKPAMATVAIVSFQNVWNSSEASSLFIDNESLKTFSFYLSTLSASAGGVSGQGVAAAASLIMLLPNLVLFIILQSRVMDTMAHSGIK